MKPAPKTFKVGALVRTRWAIGIVNLPAGAEGRVQRVEKNGYIHVEWPDKTIKYGIHWEHLAIVRFALRKVAR